MKKTFTLFVNLFIITAMAMAGSITTEQAEATARQFVNTHRHATHSKRMHIAAVRQLSSADIRLSHTEADAAAYYVFNVGDNDGYVMVSGSDLAPKVLAYANEGSFDEEQMPDNMRAWLDGYAEQIAYLERTGGRNQAPVLRRTRTAITPLLTSTWSQGKPYNNMCPEVGGKRSVTGCVATALAQVLYYYKYPAQTTAPIPAYITKKNSISMPEIPITTIDWENMIDSYKGSTTTAQQNAVAQLMLLCGQAVEMNYDPKSSGAQGTNDVKALRQYFGYDQTVEHLTRNSFSADSWETIIYNELNNKRPVIYGGQSTTGGHSFVVDGYDGSGMFHINWGWGGTDNHYFLLSVLNPYNNTDIGSNSSDDGFSFDQQIIIGINHGSGEKTAERLFVSGFTNTGDTTYTRESNSVNFTGISTSLKFFNMSGETHSFYIRLALCDTVGNIVAWACKSVNIGELQYLYGYNSYPFNMSFGADLPDGDYYIVPYSWSENSEDWAPCWGSVVYRIKANIKGNTLTLTEPTVSLTGTITATGSTALNTTIDLKAQITNTGTTFNDYLYLFVDTLRVGGRIFEAAAGETATFDIDFVPTTMGTKLLQLCYKVDDEYIPFAYGTVTITPPEGTLYLIGNLTLTNAGSNGVIEENSARFTAIVRNPSSVVFNNKYICIDLYKLDVEANTYMYQVSEGANMTIASGDSVAFDATFTDLQYGGKYLAIISYTLDNGTTWVVLEKTETVFEIFNPSTIITLTADDKSREYGEENPVLTYTLTGNGTMSGEPYISCDATQTSPVGTYDIVISRGTVTNAGLKLANGTLTITKAPLTITAMSYNIKQGEELPYFDWYGDGYKNQDGDSALTTRPIASCSATPESEPGEYEITISGASAENYDISYVSGKLVISPADSVTITANSYSREYGEYNPIFGFSTEGAPLNGVPEISCEATFTSPAGTYPIIVKKGSVTNYNVTYVAGVLTVEKAPLSVYAGNYSRNEGDENPAFELRYEGWKNDEDENVLITKPVAVTSATANSPAGDYPVTVSGGEAQNYSLTYHDGTLTILPSTGIESIINEGLPFNIYTLTGIEVRHEATSLEGLSSGMYIAGGQKIVIL